MVADQCGVEPKEDKTASFVFLGVPSSQPRGATQRRSHPGHNAYTGTALLTRGAAASRRSMCTGDY
eukprot:10250497-Alexandrium_andersonii.AAC.1